MIYEHTISGRKVRTGDIIHTRDGTNSIYTLGFNLLGKLKPGEVDHTIIYIGPGGLCVESGLYGVIMFDCGKKWNSAAMFKKRGLMDTFHAASSVLEGRELPAEKEEKLRIFVRGFVLGCVGKPYNINFLDPDNERALYCSQLVYQAYKNCGIELNVGKTGGFGKYIDKVIFPQEILDNTTLIEQG